MQVSHSAGPSGALQIVCFAANNPCLCICVKESVKLRCKTRASKHKQEIFERARNTLARLEMWSCHTPCHCSLLLGLIVGQAHRIIEEKTTQHRSWHRTGLWWCVIKKLICLFVCLFVWVLCCVLVDSELGESVSVSSMSVSGHCLKHFWWHATEHPQKTHVHCVVVHYSYISLAFDSYTYGWCDVHL